LIELNELAAQYFASALWSGQRGAEARAVLERRGVGRQTAERFQLGYAPDSFEALRAHLQQKTGASAELLAEAGLCSQNEQGRIYDRFRNRLMFPIRDRAGQVVGFGARALGDDMPKYLNSPQTAIFNKSAVLYAIEKALPEVRKQRSIVVVEGYMDALTAHQFGFTNVVASMGTALTGGQVAQIRRYVDRVFLALDSDAAGQLATLRAVDALRESFSDESAPAISATGLVRFERALGAEIRVVVLSEGKDPDELIRSDPRLWQEAIDGSVPLVEWVLRARLSDIERTPAARANALREVAAPLLREIRDPVLLSDYVGLTARLLGYKDTDVRAALVPRYGRRELLSPTSERPSAVDPEAHLVSLLLRYPLAQALRQGILYQIDLSDVVDVRYRAIVDAILSHEADIVAAIADLPEPIAEFALAIRHSHPIRADLTPGMAGRELTQAILALQKDRHEERLRNARQELTDSQAAGDSDGVRLALARVAELSQLNSRFDPGQSSYFRDLRTPTR
jgi:DNA primase